MRHKRKKRREISPWPVGVPTPNQVAEQANYTGSAEHKDYPSPAGNPNLRSDASPCDPRYTDLEQISPVIREAIRRRCTSSIFEGVFPKYAWGWLDGKLYEARLTNRTQGHYKGYPLDETETPIDAENRLDWNLPIEPEANGDPEGNDAEI